MMMLQNAALQYGSGGFRSSRECCNPGSMAGKIPPVPDAGNLYEAALTHLSRFAATEAGLARVLGRRIDRWVRAVAADREPEEIAGKAAAARGEVAGIIVKLRAAGALNDQAFAQARARRLAKAGKSRQASLAHLAGKGVNAEMARAVLHSDEARELAAACVFLRRRRAAPFGDADPLKVLGAMARGGFSQEIARRAMRLPRDEAEQLIIALKQS